MDQKYTSYSLQQLENLLAIPSPSGFTAEAAEYLMKELEALGYAPVKTVKGGVFADLGGASRDGILLTSHVDTLGGMVSTIKPNGRLRITPLGGLSPTNTCGENVTIHTRCGKIYTGTYQLENASVHVNLDYKETKCSFQNMEVVIDEQVYSTEDTKMLGIENGDIVCFDTRTTITPSGYIKSRFLDDKLSAAILLAYAKYLKEEGKTPNRRVYLHFTVYEEVGHGACGSVPEDITEILAVDMGCVGDGLVCDETMVSICAKDSQGPSSYEVVSKLIELAKENQINYGVDVYPLYGSDADAALRAGYDVKHCTVGAGVYASHGYERSHIEGVKNTFDLITAYTC